MRARPAQSIALNASTASRWISAVSSGEIGAGIRRVSEAIPSPLPPAPLPLAAPATEVLVLVGEDLRPGDRLLADRRLRIVVAEDRAVDLDPALERLLHQQPAIVVGRDLDGVEQRRAVVRPADPDARSEVGRLHEERVPQRPLDLGGDRRRRRSASACG